MEYYLIVILIIYCARVQTEQSSIASFRYEEIHDIEDDSLDVSFNNIKNALSKNKNRNYSDVEYVIINSYLEKLQKYFNASKSSNFELRSRDEPPRKSNKMVDNSRTVFRPNSRFKDTRPRGRFGVRKYTKMINKKNESVDNKLTENNNSSVLRNETNIQKIPKNKNDPLSLRVLLNLTSLIDSLTETRNTEMLTQDVEEPRLLGYDITESPSVEFISNPQANMTQANDKFLSIFTVLNFENSACQTSNQYGSFSGICYHEMECHSLGGAALGLCARAYGVCCVFRYTCGDYALSNMSYFLTPTYPKPSNERLMCTITVSKTGPDISQIRLDFEQLELRPPTDGTCVDDQFVVSGQNVNSVVPILCGINNGQHVYLDVTNSDAPVMLSVLSNTEALRNFRVKITQLSSKYCNNHFNCLQYYTDIEGSVESFNYQEIGATIIDNVPGYLNNLNYAICIEKKPGYCTVTYTNVQNDIEYPFQILNYDEEGGMVIPPGQAGADLFNCPDDYIVVNGVRLCGERLNDASLVGDFSMNAPVTDFSAGPFVLPVRTNQNNIGRGFKLFYKQNKCMN